MQSVFRVPLKFPHRVATSAPSTKTVIHPRKSHKKSRTGCKTCKQRRIKVGDSTYDPGLSSKAELCLSAMRTGMADASSVSITDSIAITIELRGGRGSMPSYPKISYPKVENRVGRLILRPVHRLSPWAGVAARVPTQYPWHLSALSSIQTFLSRLKSQKA